MVQSGARVIDVSVTVRPDMPIYDGDPGVVLELAKAMDRGDPANVSRLEMGAHTGTHVDAPCHFIAGGPGASELPLDPYIGPCVVADLTAATGPLGRQAIEALNLPEDIDRVLLKTSNSSLWEHDTFVADFVRLSSDGARAFLDSDVRLVGIDYLSIGDPGAHQLLLERGVGVIEGLDLRGVQPGQYFLICLPLKIADSDGAPARALLVSLQP